MLKIKKRKKSKRMHGTTTYGHGARKKWKGSGHHGGVGMAGTGKRADQKKSFIIKLYGNKYFGKQGVTSKSTKRKKEKVMNLDDIQKNFHSLIKKSGKGNVLDLKEYKILGDGELDEKIKIKARAFSKSAKRKIEKAGGEAVIAGIAAEEEKRKTSKKDVNKEK